MKKEGISIHCMDHPLIVCSWKMLSLHICMGSFIPYVFYLLRLSVCARGCACLALGWVFSTILVINYAAYEFSVGGKKTASSPAQYHWTGRHFPRCSRKNEEIVYKGTITFLYFTIHGWTGAITHTRAAENKLPVWGVCLCQAVLNSSYTCFIYFLQHHCGAGYYYTHVLGTKTKVQRS